MAARTVEKPSGIYINGYNWYHEGWLFGVLGLPPRNFEEWDYPVRDVDIDGWIEGYKTAIETGFSITEGFKKMQRQGQLIIVVKPLKHEPES